MVCLIKFFRNLVSFILLLLIYGPLDASGTKINSTKPLHNILVAEALYDKLFFNCKSAYNQCNTYNNQLIPINNEQTLKVEFQTYYLQLIEFKGVDEILKILMRVNLAWYDTRLKWDPSNGVKYLTVDPNVVWTPDFTLYNAAEDDNVRYNAEDQVPAKIFPDGRVEWRPLAVFVTSCPMKAKYFPFDIQLCMLKFGSQVHNSEFLQWVTTKNETDTTHYVHSNVFNLPKTVQMVSDKNYQNFPARTADAEFVEERFQDVKVFLYLMRDFKGYILNIILQCLLLALLCYLSFLIPVKSGERLSLSLSVIVAISVYQLIANEMIPLGTDEIPILAFFLFFLILLTYFSVIITMLNLRVEFETQTKPPPEWMLLKMLSICKFISRVVRFGDIRDNVIYKQWYMNEKNEEQLEGIYKHNIDTMKKLGAQRQTSCSDEFQSIKHKEGETKMKTKWVSAARKSKRIVVNSNEAQPILPQPKASDQRDSTPTKPKISDLKEQDYKLTFEEKKADIEWKLYSILLDKICMTVYLTFYMVLCIVLAFYIFSRRDQIRRYDELIEEELQYV